MPNVCPQKSAKKPFLEFVDLSPFGRVKFKFNPSS